MLLSAAQMNRAGILSSLTCSPWHLYADCCWEQVCWPFLSRAGQIWVVPQPSSWDVQWIQSAQINRALFSHFFPAAEPADNSGGRAGGPWRQWTRPVEADTLATASSLPTSLTPPQAQLISLLLFSVSFHSGGLCHLITKWEWTLSVNTVTRKKQEIDRDYQSWNSKDIPIHARMQKVLM